MPIYNYITEYSVIYSAEYFGRNRFRSDTRICPPLSQDRFEKTFELRGKGYGDELVSFAQSAMSNMIGGIGYFFGHSLVQSELSASPVKYWEAALYTAVPSRYEFFTTKWSNTNKNVHTWNTP